MLVPRPPRFFRGVDRGTHQRRRRSKSRRCTPSREEIRDRKLAGEAKQLHRLTHSKPLVELFFEWVDRRLERQGFTLALMCIAADSFAETLLRVRKSAFALLPGCRLSRS
jgi:hypothetical protein